MPQKTPQQQQSSRVTGQFIAELLEGVARSIALTVEVFLHRGFGSRYVGCGFLGVFLVFGFSLFFPGQNISPLLSFAAVYGMFWIIALVNVFIRHCRGRSKMHSLYTGRPFLWRALPSWKEMNVKQIEALAVILLGFAVRYLNRPLGDYLLLAASFVFLRGYNLAAQLRNRAVELNDSVVEQQLVAERFREMQEL